MDIAMKSESADHPNGLAWKIKKHLSEKYQRPDNVAARIELSNALRKLRRCEQVLQ
jgi:hypothetical protein